jgi:hypothetical protein
MVVVGALMYAGSAKAYCDWWWHTNYKYEEQREQNLTLAARAFTDDVRDRIKKAQAQLDEAWAQNEKECAALTAPNPQFPQSVVTPQQQLTDEQKRQLDSIEAYRQQLENQRWLAAEQKKREEAAAYEASGPDPRAREWLSGSTPIPTTQDLFEWVLAQEKERRLKFENAMGLVDILIKREPSARMYALRAGAIFYLGVQRTDQWQRAIEDAQQAELLDPKNADYALLEVSLQYVRNGTSPAGLAAQRQPLDRILAVEPNVIEVLAGKALYALNDEDLPAAASFVRRIDESTMKHSGWLEGEPARGAYSPILPADMYVSGDFTGAYKAIQERFTVNDFSADFDIPLLFAALAHTSDFNLEAAAHEVDHYCHQVRYPGRACELLTGKISPVGYDSAEEWDYETQSEGWVVGEWYLAHKDKVNAARVFARFLAWKRRHLLFVMCNATCLPTAIAAQEVRWLAASSPAERRR